MPHPLRILHLTAASDAGGLSRYLLDLCSQMKSLGHEVAIAGGRGAWHDRFLEAGIPWVDAALKGGPFAFFKSAGVLKRWLDHNPVDVIHTHYRRCTLVARRLQKRPVPVLYTVHLPRISLRGVRGWMSDFGDHTHVPSQGALQWARDVAQVNPRQITLIPHGVDFARFPKRDDTTRLAARQRLGITGDRIIGAFVGRLDDPKNPDWLIDLALAARVRLPSLTVVIAGGGPQHSQLQDRIERVKLADRVLLTGDLPPLEVYQAADALLAPSTREGFLLVGAEAMCVGVPVLRTATDGAAEMIVENVTGQSVAIDRNTFVSKAIAFMSDRGRLRVMGEHAARFAAEHFSLPLQVQRTVALYEQLIAGHKNASNPI